MVIGDAAGVARWREYLAANPTLCDRFAERHAIVLNRLAAATRTRPWDDPLTDATSFFPDIAAMRLSGFRIPSSRQAASGSPEYDLRLWRLEGGDRFKAAVAALVGDGDANMYSMSELPRLYQTRAFLHPSRDVRLIRPSGAQGMGLVALRWEPESIERRDVNKRTMAMVVDRVGFGLTVQVAQDEAILRSPGHSQTTWAIAPNLGRTLEDKLREKDLAFEERNSLIAALRQIRQRMVDLSVVWQGFAPRNMFYEHGVITLIDFEEVVSVRTDPRRAAECLIWHEVFFSDCLTSDEHRHLFGDIQAAPVISDDYEVAADEFEIAVLSRTRIPWKDRVHLLEMSAQIEGQHERPSVQRDDGILFGHEMGHYWGDFLSRSDEARIFSALVEVQEAPDLCALMELFEAAMEADFVDMLTSQAIGRPTQSGSKTLRLLTAIEGHGPAKGVTVRVTTDRWYERLVVAPDQLIDEAIVRIGMRSDAAPRSSHFLGAERDQDEKSLTQALAIGIDFMHRAGQKQPFLHHRSPSELVSLLQAEDLPVDGVDYQQVLKGMRTITEYSIAQAHPSYLAFPDSGNSVAAVAGSLVAKLLNQNLIAVDRSAPAATFIEIQVIEWLRQLVGYDAWRLAELRGVRHVAGMWTTGGHMSNHVAMLTALGDTFPELRESGLGSMKEGRPAVVMAGPIAHYSHADAAFHLGLGWDNVLTVPATEGFLSDPAAIDDMLSHPPDGSRPFMVVGVAGNCRTTGLDDLEAIGSVCREHGVWFHVDACHGGSLIFSKQLKMSLLQGIEKADSVSIDPHKGLFTPYPSSYVLFKDRGKLTQFSRHAESVMQDGNWDLGLITPFFGSRGFESLATWGMMTHLGVSEIGRLVEERNEMARYFESRLDQIGLFVRLHDVDFYRLAFVLCPPEVRTAVDRASSARGHQRLAELISEFTSKLNDDLYSSGTVCLDEHTLSDVENRIGAGAGMRYTVMAICPGNPLTGVSAIDDALSHLEIAARQYAAELIDATFDPHSTSSAPSMGGPAGWSEV